ncbi:glutaredoxin [Chryseomicrobium aureum]|uniref:glutaredoxin family protein n=1 Tax=Chryseomicrobium aureum TaxID=1441723 RepID=UPI00195E730A|nr:glutaredoxin family protein [Chryseomicrobium aureum]MBM7707216.1 glutaredoxin [Chryseomicrobium aureum]
MVKKITFYTRDQCPLCVEGRAMLDMVAEDLPIRIEEIDIEQDDEAHEKYMIMIPVVEYNGEVIQYGNLDYATLYEALDDSV